MNRNCSRCGHYHNELNWAFCQSCSRPNPDINQSILAPPPQIVTLPHPDRAAPGSILDVVSASNGPYEGELLAILPGGMSGSIPFWQLVIRRNGEQTLSGLRAELETHGRRIVELLNDKGELEERLKKALLEIEASNERARDLRDVLEKQEGKRHEVVERAQRLEDDMGKVRAALGTKGLQDILGAQCRHASAKWDDTTYRLRCSECGASKASGASWTT